MLEGPARPYFSCTVSIVVIAKNAVAAGIRYPDMVILGSDHNASGTTLRSILHPNHFISFYVNLKEFITFPAGQE